MVNKTLTELGASHEVVSGLFGVFALHFPSFGVELGEHVSMEAVKMFHKAESGRAVWHVFELFLIYSLSSDVVVVDFISCVKKKEDEIYFFKKPSDFCFLRSDEINGFLAACNLRTHL